MQRNIEHMQLSGFHFHPYPEEPQLCVCGTLAGRKNLDSIFGNSKRSEPLNLRLLQLVRPRGIFLAESVLACFSNLSRICGNCCAWPAYRYKVLYMWTSSLHHTLYLRPIQNVSAFWAVFLIVHNGRCFQNKKSHVYALDHFGSRYQLIRFLKGSFSDMQLYETGGFFELPSLCGIDGRPLGPFTHLAIH